MVTARCSTMHVPMPLVPSYLSLQTAPVQRPEVSKRVSSQGAPRRSTMIPRGSASTTEQPTPPTARKSRSMLARAAKSNEPIRSRDCAISSSGSRCEGAWLAGSSACNAPDRRQEAASAELAASLPAITLRTWSAWAGPSTRPIQSSRPFRPRRPRWAEISDRYIRSDICGLGRGWATRNRTRRRFRLPVGALRALFARLRRRPPMGVEQGGAKVESVARGFPDQRKRGRRARREAARQPILLESEMRAKLLRQFLHANILRQADDL